MLLGSLNQTYAADPMNALNSSKLSVPPTKTQQSQVPQSVIIARNRRINQARALEIIVMLAVNALLSATAVVALVQLIPYQRSQQAKLQEMQSQAKVAQERVNRVKDQFNRNFDPQQARQIMQEQTNRIDPKQRQVVWIPPGKGAGN